MTMRKNFGAPESMKLKEPVKVADLMNQNITIDEVIVSNKVKKDENGNPIMTKDGQKEIYQPYVYVAFDEKFYFSTASQLMLEQFEALSKTELRKYEKSEVPVKGVQGMKAKVSSEKVKYRDGKMYDQAVLVDPE
jgi:hypothetical protein